MSTSTEEQDAAQPQEKDAQLQVQDAQHQEDEKTQEQSGNTQDEDMKEQDDNVLSLEQDKQLKATEEETITQDEKEEDTTAPVSDESEEDQKQEEEKPQEKEKKIATPAKTATPVVQKTPSQSSSATKRKFDALHARNSATKTTIAEHEKNKKARASELMKSPATRVQEKKPATARKVTKTREFSFARPTASSARRTAANATAHAQAKVTTPLPTRKQLHAKSNKRTPVHVQPASMPAPKTPAMTDRPHFSYTPYTGPLPALTVESSFAPKGVERGARTASPARSKPGRKPHPTSAKKVASSNRTAGKENVGVNTNDGAATNATSSSKANRTPVKSLRGGSPVNKEENRAAFMEKGKNQRSIAQQDARSSSVSTTTPVKPTA